MGSRAAHGSRWFRRLRTVEYEHRNAGGRPMETRKRLMGWRALALGALFAAGPLPAAAQSTLRAGPEFRINDYTTSYQTVPVAALEPTGTYLVVWSSNGQDGSGQGVFARRVDRRGTPSGPEFQVNQATVGDQTNPSVA